MIKDADADQKVQTYFILALLLLWIMYKKSSSSRAFVQGRDPDLRHTEEDIMVQLTWVELQT